MNNILKTIQRYIIQLTVFQNLSIALGSIIFGFMIIVFLIIHSYPENNNMALETSYGWVTTSVYLTGSLSVIVLSISILIFMSLFYFLAFSSRYNIKLLLRGGYDFTEVEPNLEQERGDMVLRIKSYLRLVIILLCNTAIVLRAARPPYIICFCLGFVSWHDD